MNSVIHLGVEDMTATVVKVLLFLGALFQMVCLGACIFVKETANDSNWAPRDVTGDQSLDQHNGGGDAPVTDSGSADKPGKDDDRYTVKSGSRMPVYRVSELLNFKRSSFSPGGFSLAIQKNEECADGQASRCSTHEELREYFGKYGEIESINVKTDSMTGRSRGFAFIVFQDAASIDRVSAAGEHTINGKKVDPKKAKARHGKIFVGGISPELSDDDINEYFGQYGTIMEVEMPFDKQKNQRKGFCFITFESEQVVADLLKRPKQVIKDKEVDVKKATPKPDQMMGRGMRGGRGGPRGRGGRGFGQNWGQGGYGYGSYNQGYGYDGGFNDYYGGGYGNYGNYDYSGYSGNYGGSSGGGFQGKTRGASTSRVSNQRHQPY
ncbi:hypothetical protein HUJ04_011181 [Dendroctonus ponderosae]|nr:hypothetical protein HUJ04_011181 [Dendroctonus ponderosae]